MVPLEQGLPQGYMGLIVISLQLTLISSHLIDVVVVVPKTAFSADFCLSGFEKKSRSLVGHIKVYMISEDGESVSGSVEK